MSLTSHIYAATMRRAPGFTLTELLMVLAIGAVLTAVAAPTFSNTVLKYRLGAESTALLDSLLLARNEARQAASPVSICTSNNGTACTATAWREGHIVFRDTGTAGVVDGTDVVIERTLAAKPGITIVTTLQQTGAAFTPNFLQFGADGKLGVRTAVLFTVCGARQLPLLTAVQFNGSTSSSKGVAVCS
jgi:type IV fimbrial biogenesis protein FimT